MFSRVFSYFCSVKDLDSNKKRQNNVKKNTWLRKLKAWGLRLDRRQSETQVEPVLDDSTPHVCTNCGMEFNGRFCPQCGQDGSWNRYSLKQEGRNVLNYLGLSKDELIKTIQKPFRRKVKKQKPIKKNTWRRKLKALDLKLVRRQQVRKAKLVSDETVRVCTNCGEHYKGRYCPQCGQAGQWDRFSWRRVFLNFLDIWGLGNRPMFRTIQELFWRPGYMVRDYLRGHRQLYFPPFKLLAVSVTLTIVVNYLIGQGNETVTGELISGIHMDEWVLTPPFDVLAQGLIGFAKFLSSNQLYELLFFILFLVCCIRVAFRRVGDYNFVETFIFLIFVISQLHICDLFAKPIESLYVLAENHLFAQQAFSSSPFFGFLGGIVTFVSSLVSSAYILFTVFLFVFDFRQFYQLSWKSTIWRLILALFVAFFTVVSIVVTAAIIYKKGLGWGLYVTLVLILFFGTYYFVDKYLFKNKAEVSRPVYSISKLSFVLSIFGMPFIPFKISKLICGDFNVWITSSMALICSAIAVVIAILPNIIYKKYHNTLLALLPIIFLLAGFILWRMMVV